MDRWSASEFLIDVAFQHQPDGGIVPFDTLVNHITPSDRLLAEILLRIRMTAIDKDARREADGYQSLARVTELLSRVIRPRPTASKD